MRDRMGAEFKDARQVTRVGQQDFYGEAAMNVIGAMMMSGSRGGDGVNTP